MVSISLVPALALLYFYVSTSRSMCAVPNMAVCCSSFTSSFPGMLLMYFLNDFQIFPVAPIITGFTQVFTFQMRCISIFRSLYFKIFSHSFLNTLASAEIATSINIHIPFSVSRIIISCLLLGLFYQFVLVDSAIWLPYPLHLFLLILVHVQSNVVCPTFPPFPCIC